MPKSKRAKVVPMTQVNRKTREDKDKLFQKIRDCAGGYQHIFVVSVENMRNSHLQEVRKELGDCRQLTIAPNPPNNSLFLGKTKLTLRALGANPSASFLPNLHLLSPHVSGPVGLLFANRPPSSILAYFSALRPLDFARAGTVAPRRFHIPPGLVSAAGGEVPPEHDLPLSHTLEPELRKLHVPVRMARGRVVLGGDEAGEGSSGYTVCEEGDVLDSRQTRLLKLFGVCLSEFRVHVRAYWSAATEEVTVVEPAGQADEEMAVEEQQEE
ncbi:Ribosomal protein L10/acidic P0 [Zalerion maritima]|uniref:Ribosome assembly factor mrt4 n=1 Tax=Zalerion maritima TaxID=339359 RepID=A0AAD5RV57_9PEZI|nr:Ribosomal protein L10/acidic P0 [Zalerion maritima]